MADTLKALEAATRLAAHCRDNPDQVDPGTAAEVGIDLLTVLDPDAGTEPLRLVTSLVGFAVGAAPDHPGVPEWWETLGAAHGWLAEETDSSSEYGTAIACSLTAVSAPQAPPVVAETAAVEAAHLTGSLLHLGVQEQSITAERARLLIKALDDISLSWTNAVQATHFDFARARALRWAYPLTEDTADLARAADLLRQALAAPVLAEEGEDCVDEWGLLALVLEELYLEGGDLALLEEALAAAVKVCELLPDDHEWLPQAHGVVAAIADEIYWTTGDEASAVLDTAVTAFAAKRAAIGLDEDESVSYALLLQVRGCTAEDLSALTAAVAVLEAPERQQGSEVMLAALHELLIHLAGPEHAWPTVDWATRALCRDDLDPEVVLPLHGSRLIGVAAALEAFGGDEVAAQCDVDGVLSAARFEAADGDDAVRAELGFQAAKLRALWAADRSPLDLDLFQTTSVQMADAMLRMRAHADEDHKPKLTAVATLLRDMVPVGMGDRDPGPFLAALRDDSLAGLSDMDGLLTWMEQRAAFHRLRKDAERGQAVGPQLRQMVEEMMGQVPESERETGPGALAPIASALADAAVALESGDPAARSGAYQKVIRLCDALPENMASSPLVCGIRGYLGARLAVGGHDSGRAESAIEDLERVLDSPGGRWLEDGPELAERLGYLLRQRGGPGDAERSRQLGLRALVQQTWRVLTRHPDRERTTSATRFARVVSTWCRNDGAHDDLVRVVEAERGVVLARGAGIDLLRGHLVDTGRAALADEWMAAVGTGDAWAAQRLDLVSRLSEEDRTALAEPPGPEQIQSALRELGLDALVYLVPSHPTTGGLATVVPAEGAVTSAGLPLLAGEWFTRSPTADPAALDALGGWAWLAGGTAVLATAKAVASRGVPRIALVPVGALGAVPWAAAWRETGTGRRHLVEDVEITLIPSARLLARRSPAGAEPVLLPGGPDHPPEPHYDEALEPSSALLVRGTRAVVRGVWPADGSLLLSLFWHYLGKNPKNPAAALRAAQLWMLNPGRALPEGLSADLENPADIANWGGFACLGT